CRYRQATIIHPRLTGMVDAATLHRRSTRPRISRSMRTSRRVPTIRLRSRGALSGVAKGGRAVRIAPLPPGPGAMAGGSPEKSPGAMVAVSPGNGLVVMMSVSLENGPEVAAGVSPGNGSGAMVVFRLEDGSGAVAVVPPENGSGAVAGVSPWRGRG